MLAMLCERHVDTEACTPKTDDYSRFKEEMWSKIAEEMALPWRAAEAM
jgi:hypothetical protein